MNQFQLFHTKTITLKRELENRVERELALNDEQMRVRVRVERASHLARVASQKRKLESEI